MQYSQPVKESDEWFGNRDLLNGRNDLRHFISKEDDNREREQQQGWNIQRYYAPATSGEKLLFRRIERAEVEKQRREKNERSVVEKSDSEIQIAIAANRSVKVKDKRGQAQGRKMERVRRTAALFEEHEEANE